MARIVGPYSYVAMRLFRAIAVAALLADGASAAAAGPKAVVELFTSQGCSSCPPADAFLAELAERDDVIALAFHVDYWDYLGWKDTFGRPEHSERQSEYAAVRGDRKVYTPQMIVNGAHHFLGGNRRAVEAAVQEAKLPVEVTLAYDGDRLEIKVGANPRPAPWRATIRLVLFSSSENVGIARGENSGATMTYRNVVREVRPIGMWDGAPVAITLPAAELMVDGADGCVVLVQEELTSGPGTIIGAAQFEAPGS